MFYMGNIFFNTYASHSPTISNSHTTSQTTNLIGMSLDTDSFKDIPELLYRTRFPIAFRSLDPVHWSICDGRQTVLSIHGNINYYYCCFFYTFLMSWSLIYLIHITYYTYKYFHLSKKIPSSCSSNHITLILSTNFLMIIKS